MKLAPALVAACLIGALGVAAPATAQSISSCRPDMVIGPNGQKIDRIELNRNQIKLQLRQLGYDVDGVESWGGCIKAFINAPDGTSRIGFFDPDTLQPLRR